ncbi:MAG: hypothetical protein LUH10_02685 [Tannerellaceae bacterium]|nr:hypothetical protein [Tannerellaceae bacterium]
METTVQTIPPVPKTSLEKLCSRKRQIKQQTKFYEESIATDVDFLQHHAGSFLLSGVSSLVFPKTGKGCDKTKSGDDDSGSFNFMGLAKGFILPAALSIAQPLLLSWGLGKLPTWIINFVIKRLKKK